MALQIKDILFRSNNTILLCYVKGEDSTLKVGGGGGGLKFMLCLRIDIYQSLKRWGITLNWNECA